MLIHRLAPDLCIRPLAPSDAAGLGRLFERAAADLETERFFRPFPLTAETARDLCDPPSARRDGYFAAFHLGEPVAFSMLRGWDEGFAVPSFGVCVHPELRDVGLGKALLQHAREAARLAGAERLRLTVYRDNLRAVHVYRKLGVQLQEKNAAEWLGFLDLATPAPPAPHLNIERLRAWRRPSSAAA